MYNHLDNFALLGRVGELLVANTLLRLGYEVIDVTTNPIAQAADYDLIAKKDTAAAATKIEVKTYSKPITNLWIEMECPQSLSGYGWFKITEADYLAFVDYTNNSIHLIAVSDVKALISDKPQSEWTNGCILVPIKDAAATKSYRLIHL
jgi:hypothetical protein